MSILNVSAGCVIAVCWFTVTGTFIEEGERARKAQIATERSVHRNSIRDARVEQLRFIASGRTRIPDHIEGGPGVKVTPLGNGMVEFSVEKPPETPPPSIVCRSFPTIRSTSPRALCAAGIPVSGGMSTRNTTAP